MQRLTTRGIRTATAIRDRESFNTSGSLSGRVVPDGGLGPGVAYNSYLDRDGDDYAQFMIDCYFIDYVVWSYFTPIAWHWTNPDDGRSGWHIVSQRFSPTTSKHQGNLYMIPRDWEIPVQSIKSDEMLLDH